MNTQFMLGIVAKLKEYAGFFLKSNDRAFKFCDLILFSLKRKFNKKNLAVGWLLCGDENLASSRIQAINTHNFLTKKKIDSIIAYKPKWFHGKLCLDSFCQWILLNSNLDILIFQKVDRGVAKDLAEKCAERKIKTVYLMSDFYETDMLEICDHIVTTSNYLKRLLSMKGINNSKITVINDIIETNPSLCKDFKIETCNSHIKIVWVGHKTNWSSLQIIREALSDISFKDYQLVTISNHQDADIKWNLETVWENILKCDIAVIPVDMSETKFLTKSNNRLTMFKALGLPVICSSLPAYKDIIKHGKNGFLAESLQDWIKYLSVLNDFDYRRKIGLADREKIISLYGREKIGEEYLNLFFALKMG